MSMFLMGKDQNLVYHRSPRIFETIVDSLDEYKQRLGCLPLRISFLLDEERDYDLIEKLETLHWSNFSVVDDYYIHYIERGQVVTNVVIKQGMMAEE